MKLKEDGLENKRSLKTGKWTAYHKIKIGQSFKNLKIGGLSKA